MSLIYQPAEDSYLMCEVLEKEVLVLLNDNPGLKFLEVGCGSGVALEAAKEIGINEENILGVDINEEAIDHCKDLGFNVLNSDLFENVRDNFNLIIFNPPYLPEVEKEDEESKLATTGGKKGSEIINEFLRQAENHLAEDGKIFLLTSSLTEGIDWLNYKKKLIGETKLFMEKLFVWELFL